MKRKSRMTLTLTLALLGASPILAAPKEAAPACFYHREKIEDRQVYINSSLTGCKGQRPGERDPIGPGRGVASEVPEPLPHAASRTGNTGPPALTKVAGEIFGRESREAIQLSRH